MTQVRNVTSGIHYSRIRIAYVIFFFFSITVIARSIIYLDVKPVVFTLKYELYILFL